jgi:CxxC motif-containing protein
MDTKELICIGCPMGCNLEIEVVDGNITNIIGYACNRGLQYAKKEYTNPTRILTTTVRVSNGDYEMVSVKTEMDMPKHLLIKCIQELKNVKIEAPVKIGDIVYKNILNTGIDIISTMNVNKAG